MTQEAELGMTAGKLEDLFKHAGIPADELDHAKSSRAKSTRIGAFLNRHLDREVPIELEGRTGTAILRRREARSNQKRYYFEVQWDSEDASPAEQVGSAGLSPPSSTSPLTTPPKRPPSGVSSLSSQDEVDPAGSEDRL
jgi:hypothetical protein